MLYIYVFIHYMRAEKVSDATRKLSAGKRREH